MREEGIVKSIEKGNIVIETIPSGECKGCGSCGAARPRTISLDPSAFKDIKEGDRVTIDVDASAMMKLYILLYAVPLIVFVVSILTAYAILGEPLMSFATSLLITISVYTCVGRYLKSRPEFSPTICRIKRAS